MRIDIITIFPEIFAPLNASIVKRAIEKRAVEIKIWNLRDFTKDKHKKVDDTPYGGGKGMVLKCEPIFAAVKHIKKENRKGKIILTTPQGSLFNQGMAKRLSGEEGLIIICGHYEGVDERVSSIVDCEISIGDYVLTGGELPAMVIVDSVVRLLPGVLPEEAPVYDSFSQHLLDWPSYTKPAVFKGMKVPDVLLSGNHKKIEEWRKKQAEKRTKIRRPELYKQYLKEKKQENNYE
ncbi:MAG TPA: tRNA (guanosine(37)-N1)-methyltransferase TrmD [bacterium]|nr:tRNA (guanosine(37)-N1)-methyltransferase TrmD [bacterium]